MLIGYERVSTEEQELHRQHDALIEFGCEMFFTEKITLVSAIKKEHCRLIKSEAQPDKGG